MQLLRLLLTEPNVLLLDEPTNDLDTDTLAALEDLLDSWAGTLIVVSHDRYLIERVCDSTVALIDGAVLALPGGVDEYLARRAAVEAPASARAARGDTRTARRELTRLEREVARLERREAELHDLLADARDRLRAGQRVGRRAARRGRATRGRRGSLAEPQRLLTRPRPALPSVALPSPRVVRYLASGAIFRTTR